MTQANPAAPQTDEEIIQSIGAYNYGWHDSDDAGASARRGLDEEVVADISAKKNEPEWMLENRLKALSIFEKKPLPTWGADLSDIDFDNIKYFVRSTEQQATTWEDLPEDIKNTYDRLGIPEAEKQRLVAGVAAQYESEVVYHQIRQDLEEKGVIFLDTDTALREHEELFREYFGTVIPAGDNKFAALNTAVWSGGSFVYVPKGVHVDIPLQAYFRINTENMGQFERTLIIVDEDAYVHYVEGCTAPIYKSDSLHSAVVEIIVKKGGRCRYTTIQNWSNNVYNLVTKRTKCEEGATMEWVDGNIGSKVTMKYPAVWMTGPHKTPAQKWYTWRLTLPPILSPNPSRAAAVAPPTVDSYRSTKMHTTPPPTWNAMPSLLTTSPGQTPTPTTTSATTMFRLDTKQPSPKSRKTNCSTS